MNYFTGAPSLPSLAPSFSLSFRSWTTLLLYDSFTQHSFARQVNYDRRTH